LGTALVATRLTSASMEIKMKKPEESVRCIVVGIVLLKCGIL